MVDTSGGRTTVSGVGRRIVKHENGILGLIVVAVVFALGGMTHGRTLTFANMSNVLLQSSSRGVASIGQMFVILTGGIDLSVGGVAMLATALGAALMTQDANWNIVGYSMPMFQAVPIMVLMGLGLGAFNGVSVSRVQIPALISTLALWQITKGLGYQLCKGATILQLPRSLAFFGQGNVAGVPVPIIIFIIVAVIAYLVLYHTTFGRSVYAVGGNPVSAWLSGLNVSRILLSVYSISGLTAALAGLILIGRTMGGSTLNASGLELQTIAAVCIGGVSLNGGRGNLIGAILGVVIIGIISNGMNVMGLDPRLQDLVTGVIIYAAVSVDAVRRRMVRVENR